jgi:hypothetical protein
MRACRSEGALVPPSPTFDADAGGVPPPAVPGQCKFACVLAYSHWAEPLHTHSPVLRDSWLNSSMWRHSSRPTLAALW